MFNKIGNNNIDFDLTGSGLQNDPEYNRMIQAINECNQITRDALVQFSRIDSSVRQYLTDINKTSAGMSKYADTLMKAGNSVKNRNSSILLESAALGLEVIGTVVGVLGKRKARKQYKAAEDERNRIVESAMYKKQEIAIEKLGPLRDYREKYNNIVVSKIQLLYDKDFLIIVRPDDIALNLKIRLFKRDFGLMIKSKFLLNTLDYLISEMEAWTKGKHSSKFKKQSVIKILEKELNLWPEKCGASKEWNKFVGDYLVNTTEDIPICIATLFSDPVLLCNYVGINIYPFSTCPEGLIVSTNKGLEALQTPVFSIIESNPYYQECQNNLDSNFNPPKYPRGIGLGDLLFLVAPILVAFIISYNAFAHLSSWPLKIASIIAAGVVIYLFACIDLPVDRRYDKYSEQYDEMKKTILQRDNLYRNNNKVIKV